MLLVKVRCKGDLSHLNSHLLIPTQKRTDGERLSLLSVQYPSTSLTGQDPFVKGPSQTFSAFVALMQRQVVACLVYIRNPNKTMTDHRRVDFSYHPSPSPSPSRYPYNGCGAAQKPREFGFPQLRWSFRVRNGSSTPVRH